jgi:hypothetical protein
VATAAVRETVADQTLPADFTPEWFRTEIMRKREPVVIRRIDSIWPAILRDVRDVLSFLPSRDVRAVATGTDGFSGREVMLPPDGIRLAVAGQPSDDLAHLRLDVLTDVPELAGKLPPPQICGKERAAYILFIGRDTVSRAHYHPLRHTFFWQVHGTKRVVLFAPADSALLYPHPLATSPHFHISQVDVRVPDLRAFPEFRRARALGVTLGPGDALFIPVHWWHALYGDGPVVSGALFWRAKLREHHFPQPALRSLAGMARWCAW